MSVRSGHYSLLLEILQFLVGFSSKNYHPVSYVSVEDCIVRVVDIFIKEIFTLYQVEY